MLLFLLQFSLSMVTKSVVAALVGSQTEKEGKGARSSLRRKGRKQWRKAPVYSLMGEEGFESISQCRQPWGWREACCSFQEERKGRGCVRLCVINNQFLATDSAKAARHSLELQQAGTSFGVFLLSDHLHLMLRCSFDCLFFMLALRP